MAAAVRVSATCFAVVAAFKRRDGFLEPKFGEIIVRPHAKSCLLSTAPAVAACAGRPAAGPADYTSNLMPFRHASTRRFVPSARSPWKAVPQRSPEGPKPVAG